MQAIENPASLDPIGRFEGMISTFRNANWRNAYQVRGVTGVIDEFFACVNYANAPTISVSRYSRWRGIDIEQLLHRHGVKIWDCRVAGDELYFCVKRRQLKWAEYLLLRAGVPVTSALIEPRNTEWAEKYPPGSEPPTRRAKPETLAGLIDQLRALLR